MNQNMVGYAESLFEIKRVLYGKFNKSQPKRTDCFME